MPHHLYHTDAFILSSRARGEANKVYTLFTRELGLVTATAQGVRHLRSKLRYSLNNYMLAHVTLVRGRDVWRLVGAKEQLQYADLLKDPKRVRLAAKISALLERFIHGEEKNNSLFSLIESMFEYVLRYKQSSYDSVELLTAARILYQLGYLTPKTEVATLIQTNDWSDQIVELAMAHRSILKEVIEEGILHAHL